jgi:hypothetical protein
MADKYIRDLTAASSIALTDEIAADQGGDAVKVTLTQLKALVGAAQITDAEVIAGTATDARTISAAQAKLAVTTHQNYKAPRYQAVIETDCLGSPQPLASNVINSGTAVVDTGTDMVGAMYLSTGTAANGRGSLLTWISAFATALALGTRPARCIAIVKTGATLSDATDTVFYGIGLNDQSGGTAFLTSNQVMFSYTHSEDSGQWRLTCRNGSTESTVSGVTVAANTIYRLEWVYDGTSIEGFVDGTSIGTITTNIPTVHLGVVISVVKSVGTATRAITVDYFGLFVETNR